MFGDLKLEPHKPAYLRIKDYIRVLIVRGVLQAGARLPATRELAAMLGVGRNTVILAYQYLEDEGLIHTERGSGAYVAPVELECGGEHLRINWGERLSNYALTASELDIEKTELKRERGMISFQSIAPDESLFDTAGFRRAFLNCFSREGAKLLNYGYARGYRPLLEYLTRYMQDKGVNPEGKELLITNGFTEGLHLLLTALAKPGERIICEDPTHNTALKIMRLLRLEVRGIPLRPDGLDLDILKESLKEKPACGLFLIPSYHNPTGLILPLEKRLRVLEIAAKHQVPIFEDGFNEELRYSGAHVAPLAALAGPGNSVVYLGSFSKILFPGLRIGWIMADKELISSLESIKRSYNMHTSFLDQALLFEYLQGGGFEKYLRKARRIYRERHETALRLIKEHIPCRRIWGEGGLHLFVELEQGLDARELLNECYKQGVLFRPGDIFHCDGGGRNTFRLGISRLKPEELQRGIRIIGEAVRQTQLGIRN